MAQAALQGPEVPDALAYLYGWARQLAAVRRYDMGVPQPITYVEIEAWARLTGEQPQPHEVRALLEIDEVLCYPDAGAPPLDGA